MRMSDWSSDVCSSDLHLQVGSRVAVHCTAIGKLLVAEQHKNVRTRILKAKPLKRYTENTLTDPAALEAEFAAIRSNGYSFNNEEIGRAHSELQSLMRNSYAVFCLKKKKQNYKKQQIEL